MRKKAVGRIVAGALALGLLAGCGGQSAGGQPQDPSKKVIKLADVQWQSIWINNAIAGFIIEKGYGYPVETVEVTTPIMQQALVKGDLDVTTELWKANIIDWYNEAVGSKKILDLGPIFDRASQGWYVPAYLVKGDEKLGIKPLAPDLKTVQDLKKYKSLFQDPENKDKGLLINCITGWQCAKINRIKLSAYGLDQDYNVQEPGSSAALDAAIAGAYKRGEPFLAYYWEPTWLAGTFDLIQLEEPKYTKACDQEIQKLLADKDGSPKNVPAAAGCAYETEVVTKAVHPSLKERAPEVVTFLEKMNIGTDNLNKVSAYMEQEKVKADKAAIWYFENYQDQWRSWLPAEVVAKVEQALKDAGAKL